MAQKTRLDLIDDLELRLTRLRPTDDLPLTKALLGNWIDQARDSFISDKIREMSGTNNRLSGAVVENEILDITKTNLSTVNLTRPNITFSKPPLYVANKTKPDPAILSAVLFTLGDNSVVTSTMSNINAISRLNVDDIVVIAGISAYVGVSFDGGQTFESRTHGGLTTTPSAVLLFPNGEIWVQIAALQGGSSHYWYYSKDMGQTWVQDQGAGSEEVFKGLVQPKNGDVSAMYIAASSAGASDLTFISEAADTSFPYSLRDSDFEGTPTNIQTITMITKSIVWITADGSKVWRSTEGVQGGDGTDPVFKDVSFTNVTEDIISADFADAYEGAVLPENSAPFWTMDGGANWTEMVVPVDLSSNVYGSIYSFGAGEFVLTTPNTINTYHTAWITKDYGTTWAELASHYSPFTAIMKRDDRYDILVIPPLSTTGYMTKLYNKNFPSRQGIKITNAGFIDGITNLRFAKPNKSNIIGYREGSATKLYFEGPEAFDLSDAKVNVSYIAEAQAYADSDTYPLDAEDIVEVMEMAKQVGMEALGIPALQDDINDGNFPK